VVAAATLASRSTLAHRLLWCRHVRGLIVVSLLAAAALMVARAAQPAPASDCIVLDDFSRSTVGAFPTGWEVRKDEGKGVYRVSEEGGRRFLAAVSRGLGIQAGRETQGWNLATHPVLAWSWRPAEFPKGSDERESATNDSALAVYMAIPYSKIRGPKAVKYVWSEKVPAGTRLSSNSGLTHVRVLRTGHPTAKGAWVEERVNVRDEWKAAFKESETPKVGGIAVLTDADDTRSSAAGDYADFRACRE
jgi:Protein of unknown function (DUF3047)